MINFLFIILIMVVGLMFAVLNSESVTIQYYFSSFSLPLSLLLVLIFASGALLGMSVGLWLLLKAKIRNYRLQQRLQLAEKEIDNLRAVPLKDSV